MSYRRRTLSEQQEAEIFEPEKAGYRPRRAPSVRGMVVDLGYRPLPPPSVRGRTLSEIEEEETFEPLKAEQRRRWNGPGWPKC